MRNQIKKILESLHILLIFSMVLPIIYMLGMQRETGTLTRLYLAGYLMVVPLVILKQAACRSSSLPIYLLSGVIALLTAGLIAQGAGRLILPGEIRTGYLLYMLVGTVVIAMEEYSVRMYRIRQKRAKEEMDNSWRQREFALDKPHLYVSAWYVLMYLAALNFDCPEVCNLAILSFFLYLVIAVIYQFIENTEKYLSINDTVCHVQNIPYKRIFGIGKYFVLSFLLVILLAVIPTVLTIPYRQYKDLREWIQERNVDYAELLEQAAARSGGSDPMADVVFYYGEAKEMPVLVKMLFYAIGIGFFIAILYAALKWIRGELRDFKAGIDEDGDIVENLIPEAESFMTPKRSRWHPIEEERIRREYRRFIRSNRKDCPALYETPREIEVLAGVADTMEGKAMHDKYEMVRYGHSS
ncbi:MAG: hypothetical protein ACI4C4_11975 [Lachnospiraceae bacterium]